MSRRRAATTLATALAVVMAAVALVSPAPTAAGAVQMCRVTYSAPGGAIKPKEPAQHSLSAFNITVDDPRVVADIDITIDVQHPQVGDLSIHLLTSASVTLAPNVKAVNHGAASGPLDGVYTFDDEAPSGTSLGVSSPPGTYRPQGPATEAEGAPGNAKAWSLWVLNYGESPGLMRSVRISVTFATCDSDGDGVDDLVDSCPLTPDATQVNSDDDSVGDACDIDDDNDGVDDTADRCPVVAAPGGCPTAARTVSLTPRAKARKVVVTVRAALPACRVTRTTLWRVRKGADARAGSGRTSARGTLTLKAPQQPGAYYALVAPTPVSGAVCAEARSKRVKISRPRA